MILQYHYNEYVTRHPTEYTKYIDVWVQTARRAVYYRHRLSDTPAVLTEERRRIEVIAELALHQALVVGD